MFEEIDHTADLAIRVVAKDLSALLEEAAKAVMVLSGIDLESGPSIKKVVHLTANDPESLLVQWLEELLFNIEVKDRGSLDFSIMIKDRYHLTATLKLVPISGISRSIKAVTFHDLSIKTVEDRLETIIVFDV